MPTGLAAVLFKDINLALSIASVVKSSFILSGGTRCILLYILILSKITPLSTIVVAYDDDNVESNNKKN
jgi:hypothetical protein